MTKSSIGIKHSEVRAMALASPAARASYEQELLTSARKALARGELIIPISTGTFIEVIEAREAAENRVADMEVACELYAESMLAQIKLEAELVKKLVKAQQRIEELEISRDKCFLSGLKTGWEYGIADDTEGYNREIADVHAVIDRAAGVAAEGE